MKSRNDKAVRYGISFLASYYFLRVKSKEPNSQFFVVATNGFVVFSVCRNMECEMFITFKNTKGTILAATLTI
jgi:hypothetical protein